MKKIIYLAFFSFSLFGFSQTITENFVKTTTFRGAGGTSPVAQVTYFDGLGRPIQQVAQGQSATGKDIITHIEYDSIGRQKKEYLPFAGTTNSSNFDTSALSNTMGFYADPNKVQDITLFPFSEKLFEASPLNRVLKQAASGEAWKMGSNHEIKMDFQTNTATEVKKFVVTTTWNAATKLYDIGIASPGNYLPNQLYKTITYDENTTIGTNGGLQEFKDKEGKVILKRTFNGTQQHNTFYIYDIYGNLTYVIPPLADGSIAQVDLDGLCYQYKYDHRNRLVEKKLPGKQWEFIVYDNLDRVVATGPALSPWGIVGEMGWLISKYDALGRPIYSGWEQVITPITTILRADKQSIHNNATVLFESKNTSGIIDGVAVNYSNDIAPTNFKILTVNYYDDYLFPNMPAIPTTILGQSVFYNNTQKPKGMPTGSWIRVLDNSSLTTNEMSYTLYDNKARPIRIFTKNHLGGYTQVDSKLDFVGKTILTETSHKRLASNPEIVVREDFVYSAQDRLLTHTHQINNGATQQLVLNSYTQLGQLKTKYIGSEPALGEPSYQKVDYAYNIRGWLTDINNIDNLVEPLVNDLFAFRINYNKQEVNATPLFNGNISTTNWRTANDGVLRKYSYRYDELNRMTYSHYQKPGITTSFPGSYDEALIYDKNGNITILNRWGYQDNDSGAVIEIDKLDYTYASNQLQEVYDNSNSTNGFKDGNLGGIDYDYDSNGNMIVDRNKGVQQISYNHLNLPSLIVFENQKSIYYLYNAVGTKLQKNINDLGTLFSTDYLNGFQYSSSAPQGIFNGLQFFPHAEGYVNVEKGRFNYVYNYTDHLGNIRLSYSKDRNTGSLKIIEENNYYPFGLTHTNYNIQKADFKSLSADFAVSVDNPIVIKSVARNDNQYKYNGKELQDELGLNVYDYGARNYDAALGRWGTTDKKSELYFSSSPYAYASNTPVNAIDPDGNIVIFINGQHSGSGGSPDYWRNYTGREINFMSMSNRQAFDISVMNHLGDRRALYRDGAMGGTSNTNWEADFSKNNLFSSSRINGGYEQGKNDAKSIIANLARDKTTGEIVETIKIITHSMGAAYGKGYVKALKEYITSLPKEMQYQVKITLVADFDPYQGGSLTADKNIKTQQFMHEDNTNIFGMGWLANENENGLDPKKDIFTNTGKSTNHSIMSFFNDIKNLSEGTYKWDGKRWEKQ